MHKAILYTYFGPALCHCTAVGTKTSSSSVLCLGNSDEKEKKVCGSAGKVLRLENMVHLFSQ